jgi:hypothetical protein|tara:strand:- start:38 stop:307 length:270 start_codon:yes stop_codon:yes gene_type:complete
MNRADLHETFGLNAYEKKYGVIPLEQTDDILNYQFKHVADFIIENAPNICDTNYLVIREIVDEINIRNAGETNEQRMLRALDLNKGEEI